MGSVIQVAENKGVRHTLAILDHCSLKVKVKSKINKTSQNIMATREEYAANHGELQPLASGGGARLLTQPPAAVCCRVPPSLEDGYRTGVEESQYPKEAAQGVRCAESRSALWWGGRMDLHPMREC